MPDCWNANIIDFIVHEMLWNGRGLFEEGMCESILLCHKFKPFSNFKCQMSVVVKGVILQYTTLVAPRYNTCILNPSLKTKHLSTSIEIGSLLLSESDRDVT